MLKYHNGKQCVKKGDFTVGTSIWDRSPFLAARPLLPFFAVSDGSTEIGHN